MASIQQDPSGNYHVSFRFGGKRFKRSLKTKIHRKAEAAARHIEENIRLIEGGRMTLPEDADIATFLMSDGRLRKKVKTQESIRLDNLLDRFKTGETFFTFEPVRCFRREGSDKFEYSHSFTDRNVEALRTVIDKAVARIGGEDSTANTDTVEQ